MKAIAITKANQHMLMIRYNSSDFDEFPPGYILVTWFGDNGDFKYRGVLSEANFNAKYVKGEALENGFFAVRKIDAS